MAAVAAVAAMVAALIVVAATVSLCLPISGAFRDTWRRLPDERRGLAGFGIGMMVVGGIAGAVLLTVGPWGTDTIVWLILVGVPALILVWIIAVSIEAVMDGRRPRNRRRPNP